MDDRRANADAAVLDREVGIADQEVEAADQEVEAADQEVEAADQEVEAADHEVEAADQKVEIAAVKLLGNREHGRRELTRKLVSKGHAREVVEAVMDRLVDLDLVSDGRFAEGFVRSRVGRGHGPLRIRAELRDRGVDDLLVDEVLTETSEYWRERAECARQKRFGDALAGTRDAWTRQARFLSQRGFPSDVIYRVLGSLD